MFNWRSIPLTAALAFLISAAPAQPPHDAPPPPPPGAMWDAGDEDAPPPPRPERMRRRDDPQEQRIAARQRAAAERAEDADPVESVDATMKHFHMRAILLQNQAERHERGLEDMDTFAPERRQRAQRILELRTELMSLEKEELVSRLHDVSDQGLARLKKARQSTRDGMPTPRMKIAEDKLKRLRTEAVDFDSMSALLEEMAPPDQRRPVPAGNRMERIERELRFLQERITRLSEELATMDGDAGAPDGDGWDAMAPEERARMPRGNFPVGPPGSERDGELPRGRRERPERPERPTPEARP